MYNISYLSEENNGLDDSDKLFDVLLGKNDKKKGATSESDGGMSDGAKPKGYYAYSNYIIVDYVEELIMLI